MPTTIATAAATNSANWFGPSSPASPNTTTLSTNKAMSTSNGINAWNKGTFRGPVDGCMVER